MLPNYWKDICLLSPPRGPVRLGFYSLRLLTAARVQGQRTGVSALHEPIFGEGNWSGPRDGVEGAPSAIRSMVEDEAVLCFLVKVAPAATGRIP